MLQKGLKEYKISIDYDDYFANSQIFKASNIEVIGDSIMFTTDKETINMIETKNIRYMLHYDKKDEFKKFFKHKTGIIIGIIIVMFMIAINSFRVNKIEFSGNYPINENISEYITKQNQQILFFSFHKHNYDELSRELRSVFSEYEWINVRKKGSTIFVDIEPTTTKEITPDDNMVGNIIAKKSGMVSEFVVFNGKGMVEVNTYIKEGQVLISGENKKAKGYVLATVYEQMVITVNKELILNEFSGKVNKYTQVGIFNKFFDINKKIDYKISEMVVKNIFTIPYIININKIEEYEKNDIIYTYDKEEAISYAKTIIENDFNNSKILDGEKILRLEELVVIEESDSYVITFLVKKVESIGEFKENI